MNRKGWQTGLTVLILLNLAFIWGNSLLAGAQSSQVSGGVMALLHRLLPFLPQQEWVHGLIRKLAHFSEFAVLGLLCAALSQLKTGRIRLGLPGAGLAAACVDETIQLYVPGRASSLLDVWIDTAGFVFGMAVLLLGYHIIQNKQVWRTSK